MAPATVPSAQVSPPSSNGLPSGFSLFPLSWRSKFFVNASMSTSHVLNGRLSGSLYTSRGGPFAMKFGSEWLHKDCPTYKWYKTQREHGQQKESSTRFKSIQHRRSRDSPFFHEFLILKLVDGSLYRLERTGVGSNTDAILPAGCMAQDLIEWFPADEYDAFALNKPSDLIWEVRFPTEFDLLDVLAVCYAIQQGSRTRVYTLQRYNCYFFCCALLSVLARRAAGWETLISSDQWDPLLDKALEQVSHSIKSPPAESVESQSHIVPRLFSMLDPDPHQPSQCLVEALRRGLGSRAGGHQNFVRAYAASAWWSDISSSMTEHLGAHIHDSAFETRTQDKVCAIVFDYERHIPEQDFKGATLDGRTVRLYKAKYLGVVASLMDRRRDAAWKALYREQRISLGAYLLASTCGPPVGVVKALAKMNCKKRRAWAEGLSLSSRIAYAVSWGRTAGPHIILAALASQPFTKEDWVTHSNDKTDISTLELPILHAVLDGIAKDSYEPSDVDLVIEQCFAGLMPKDRNVWGERTVGPLLYSALETGVKDILRTKEARLELSTLEGDTLSTVEEDIQAFQMRIRQHVRAYADRVDAYKLSVSEFVTRDVEGAIAELWKSMPQGFGAHV